MLELQRLLLRLIVIFGTSLIPVIIFAIFSEIYDEAIVGIICIALMIVGFPYIVLYKLTHLENRLFGEHESSIIDGFWKGFVFKRKIVPASICVLISLMASAFVLLSANEIFPPLSAGIRLSVSLIGIFLLILGYRWQNATQYGCLFVVLVILGILFHGAGLISSVLSLWVGVD